MLSETDVERRKPVWTAFSELWLDIELDDDDVARIARVATASGYSLAELRAILLHEVAPVVSTNLRSVAGEWSGFDEQWLHAQVRQHVERRTRPCRLFRAFHRFTTSSADTQWRRIAAHLGPHEP